MRIRAAAARFFINLVSLLGLMIVAWGVDDLNSFFSHPARLIFAALIFLGSLASAYLAYTDPAPQPHNPDAQPPMDYWRLVAMETLYVLAAFGDRRGILVMRAPDVVRYIGLLVYAAGMAWVVGWVLLLRRQKAADQNKSEYVRLAAWPYRSIRYPRYLGVLFSAIGAALIFRSWAAIALAAFMLIFLVRLVQEEEIRAQRELGTAWDQFRKKSWRIIPWIY